MANNKIGLSYFNIDTDRYQDIKIKRLKKDFGCDGLAAYDYILCEIYRVKGCFLEWDDSTAFDVADYLGLKETLVKEIVNYCGVVGLFDKALLTGGRIITSLSIQKRYIEMCLRAKRTNIAIPENIKLTEECAKPPEESPKLPEESIQNSGSLPQSKVKKSKEEKKKEKDKETPKVVSPPYSEIVDSFNLICKSLPKVQSLAESRKNKIKARWAEIKTLEKFTELFGKAESCAFLKGENKTNWKATFDWLIENDNNWLKVMEGQYDKQNTQNNGTNKQNLQSKDFAANSGTEKIPVRHEY